MTKVKRKANLRKKKTSIVSEIIRKANSFLTRQDISYWRQLGEKRNTPTMQTEKHISINFKAEVCKAKKYLFSLSGKAVLKGRTLLSV